MLHPWRFRLPLWAAIAIAAALYIARSVLRGFDFRLDLPADAAALGMFVLVLGLVWFIRTRLSDDEPDEGSAGVRDEGEHAEGTDTRR